TAARFMPEPEAPAAGARLYRTGDLARRHRDGAIQFLGRTDHQIKLRGYRVELGEVEALLGRHPAVRDVAVVARSSGGDARLTAHVVTPGTALPKREIRTWLERQLPPYMIPTTFVQLDALPLSPAGKVDRAALPAPPVERHAGGEYAPP